MALRNLDNVEKKLIKIKLEFLQESQLKINDKKAYNHDWKTYQKTIDKLTKLSNRILNR